MSSIVIAGDTSGTITLSAPAVAGSNTISLPAVTGTILTTAYTGAVTFDGDFTVDTNTLHVDSTNNRVGIGKTNPTTALDVVGTVTATAFAGALTGNVTGDVSGNAGTVTNGVYTTDIGSTVQAYDAGLTSIAGLTTAANKMIYATASDTYAVTDLTAAGRAILDDADAAAQRTTLGLGTAATTASTDYATAAQGTLADSALQPADIGSTVQAYDADTAKLDVAQTFTANQAFADGVYAKFGAGDDLLIRHDGANSTIIDNGTGSLYIGGSTVVQITNPAVSSSMAKFETTGAATLYYNGSPKIATSSTGITVTGTVAATAYTGDGSGLTGIGGGASLRTQVFTSPGTWTNPGAVTRVKVTVIGGGAGMSLPPNPAYPGSAGGTSSFGSYVSATGGQTPTNPSSKIPGSGTVSTGTPIVSGPSATPTNPWRQYGGNTSVEFGDPHITGSTNPVNTDYSVTSYYMAGAAGEATGTYSGTCNNFGGVAIADVPIPTANVPVTVGSGGNHTTTVQNNGKGGGGVVVVEWAE